MYARLSDPTDGYTPILASLATENGVTFGTSIDFAAGSRNFFRANLTDTGILRASRRVFPTMSLFLISLVAGNRIKDQAFFGDVTIGVNVFLSDGKQEPPEEQETVNATVAAALMTIFGDVDDRSWGDDEITFANDYGATFNPVRLDGYNWLDVVRFTATFECGPIIV